jgi:hypothetical protein
LVEVAAGKNGRNADTLAAMKRIASWLVAVVAASLLLGGAVGCKSSSGSREFIPGRGWRPV